MNNEPVFKLGVCLWTLVSSMITDSHPEARAGFPGDTFQFLPSMQELLLLQTETLLGRPPAATAACRRANRGPSPRSFQS